MKQEVTRRQMLQMASGACATAALAATPALGAGLEDKGSTSGSKISSKPPNLLFFLTDQQRRDTMAAYGNHQIHTPNLNKLTSEAVVFETAYVTQPVCTPSKGCMLTGLYPHTHGATHNNFPLPASIPVLPEMLRRGEYKTAYFGKWHLGNETCRQHGFDEFESTEDDYYKYSTSKTCAATLSGYSQFLISHGLKPNTKHGFSRGYANKLPIELSKAAYVAQQAIRFMEAHREEPWVIYVSFLDPHPPFSGPYDKLYDPAKMPVSPTFSTPLDPTVIPETKTRRQWEIDSNKQYIGSVEAVQKFTAIYWGKVTLVDEMAGRVLDRLQQLELKDNTAVSYTSDHGEMLGSHQMTEKSVVYDQAATVPLLLRIPWAKNPAARVDTPVSQIDLVPTLLDLLGQDLPAHLQGRSFAPSLVAGSTVTPRDVIVEWNLSEDPTEMDYKNPLRTIVTPEGWKLTLTSDGMGELYDRNRDPEETKNLFYEEEMLPTVLDLSHRIELWQHSTGDKPILFTEELWRKQQKSYAHL
jgi:arylsulfatase A-like enzyme